LKILFLTDYPLTWDQAPSSRLLYLSREFLIAGHNVRVVGSHTDSPAEIDGIKMVTLPYHANCGIKKASFALRKEIRQHIRWCDAIIVRGYWIGIFALIYAALSGVKIKIYDFHGFAWKEQFGKHRIMRSLSTYWIELLILFSSSTIIAVSQGVMNELPRYAKQKGIVVENGVCLEEFQVKPSSKKIEELRKRYSIPDEKTVFAVVATFVSWLNTNELIYAAHLLKDIAEIMLIGNGPGIDNAEKELAVHKTDNVHIVGRLNNNIVVEMLTGLFYGCLCPYDINWPNSQIPNYYATRKNKEYLAAGLPVIVSDIPGRETFFHDGETCLLYKSGDSGDLAAKIRQLVKNPDLKNRIGENGRKIANNFSWEKICKDSGLLLLFGKK